MSLCSTITIVTFSQNIIIMMKFYEDIFHLKFLYEKLSDIKHQSMVH